MTRSYTCTGSRQVLLLLLPLILFLGCEQRPLGTDPEYGLAGWEVAYSFESGRPLRAVWCAGQDDVYAGHLRSSYFDPLGEAGTRGVYHYDGTSWQDLDLPGSPGWGGMDIWGTGPDNIYVANFDLYRYNGADWILQPVHAHVVAGLDENHVYAADKQYVYHFNGDSWNILYSPEEDYYFPEAMWVGSGPAIFVARNDHILQLHNGTWQEIDLPFEVTDLWGSGPDDVYAIGHNSWSHAPNPGLRIWHFDGSGWTPVYEHGGWASAAIWGSDPGDMFLSGYNGTIVKFDGGNISPEPPATQSDLYDIHGAGPDNIYAVGSDQRVLRYDGQSWASIWFTHPMWADVVWAESVDRMAATKRDGSVYIFQNDQWTETVVDNGRNITDLWGTSFNNLYAVSTSGGVYRYDGNNWSKETELDGTPQAIHGTGDNDIHVIGYYRIYHYNGSSWQKLYENTAVSLQAVWAVDPDNAFAVGYHDVILRYNGTGWVRMDAGGSYGFTDVWGSSGDNAVAVGYGGIVHYDGRQWTRRHIYQDHFLSTIVGRAHDDIITTGWSSSLGYFQLHYDGHTWNLEEGAVAVGGLTVSQDGRYMITGRGRIYVSNR